MKYLLVYHEEDNDGLFSAAIVYDYLCSTLNVSKENIVLYPATYARLNEIDCASFSELHEQYGSIIMTDISFSNAQCMETLYKEFGHDFIWFDHHAPIIKSSYKYTFNEAPGIRDTNRSAILNAYKFLYDPLDEFYNEKQVPELLRILSAYDSWSYEREGYEFNYVRNINKGVTITYNLDFNSILKLVHDVIQVYHTKQPEGAFSTVFRDSIIIKEMHDLGKQLNEYDDLCNENIIKTAGDCSWKIITNPKEYDDAHGHLGPTYRTTCAIFHQGPSNSTMFKSLIHNNNDDIMNGIVFKHCKNGNWVLSLYNIRDYEPKEEAGGFHCGKYLKEKYNGGGHMGAAGCTLTEEQFIKILKEKKI